MAILAPRCFGIGGDGEHGLGRGLEQEVVDHRLVLVGDVADRGGQREDDVEVGHGQQLGLPLLHPVARRRALALRAMPVAAAVVGDDRVAAQSSQRATCPPRAAVRQLSMALITFSWARLTWPRLASRQAAPWSRKMSATSRAGRATTPALLRRLRPLLGPNGVSRSSGLITVADHVGCDVRVARGRVQLGMSQQHLDHAHVDVLLQEMRREASGAACAARPTRGRSRGHRPPDDRRG